MTFLFMGGEAGSLTPSDGAWAEITTSGKFDASFARCAMAYNSSGSSAPYVETTTWASEDISWFHFDWTSITSGSTLPIIQIFDGSTAFARVTAISAGSGTNTMALQYWNGASWTTVESTFTMANTLDTFDVRVEVSTGTLALYVSGTRRAYGTGIDLSDYTGSTKAQFAATSQPDFLSQVIVKTTPTVGMKLGTYYLNGAGATNTFTSGAYSDIDEITYSDADFISSATANQIATFSQTGPSPTGYTVLAVAVTARAKCGALGPQNLQLALRVGSTNYFSGSKLLDVGQGSFVNIWETNPATSSVWLDSEISTLQPGVKSIT